MYYTLCCGSATETNTTRWKPGAWEIKEGLVFGGESHIADEGKKGRLQPHPKSVHRWGGQHWGMKSDTFRKHKISIKAVYNEINIGFIRSWEDKTRKAILAALHCGFEKEKKDEIRLRFLAVYLLSTTAIRVCLQGLHNIWKTWESISRPRSLKPLPLPFQVCTTWL